MTIDPARAADLIGRFHDQAILVVGDVMLDRFIVGRVTRISPEAPVPIVRFESEYTRLGGAANVANNIAALGGRALLVGVVGADNAGERLTEQLAAAGIGTAGLVRDSGRPTTEKVRVVTERHQQVARIDYERDDPVAASIAAALCDAVSRLGPPSRAALVSDYLKGVVARPLIDVILATAGTRIPTIVDPKIPNLACYRGATLVTPNHHEAETATHMRIRSDDEARVAAQEFRARAQCDSVLITRGEHGMCLSERAGDRIIPAVAREVADVTGAGDTVAATLALALAAGATLFEAATLANAAAGIAVGKFGPATVSAEELRRVVTLG